MKQKNDGGPAFPTDDIDEFYGMSLRDYFAGQALAGGFAFGIEADDTAQEIADACYHMADAMIAARETD